MSDKPQSWCRCGPEYVAETVTNRVEGMCLIVECTACGDSVMTTNPDPMLYDSEEYAVFADTALSAKQAAVRIAVALGRSSRDVLGTMARSGAIARGARANEVIRVAGILAQRGIGVRVEPAFRWPLPDVIGA